MTRVIWSEPAAEQLLLIRKAALRTRVFQAIGGLTRYPLRGRRPPEVHRFPELELPDALREIVFPRTLRVFSLFDDRHDLVRVLGMTFRGQQVGTDWLDRLLEG